MVASNIQSLLNTHKEFLEILKWLGLDGEEAAIYLLLTDRGELSTLEISRYLQLPRTSIYRKIENMKHLGLIEEIIDEYRTKAKAVDWEKVEYLVKQKRAETERYLSLLPALQKSVMELKNRATGFTNVRFYRGQENVARMSWGALQTKDIFRGYSYRSFAELIGKKQAEEFQAEWKLSGKTGREIYSDEFTKSLKEKPELDIGTWMNWESRYIPSDLLKIDHQLDIYNDVVAIYNWYEGEVFGIQILNGKVADFQKQLFDLVWKQAKQKPEK